MTDIIRVVDLECSSDTPETGAPCEFGYADVIIETGEVIGPTSMLLCPGMPMNPEAQAVHHITDEDVARAPRWNDMLPMLTKSDYRIAAFAAHSANFEQLWITPEITGNIPFICTWKCSIRAWPEAPKHSNQVLRYWRKPSGLVRELADPAHRAGPDAYVTAFHVRDLMKIATVFELIEWTEQPALLPKMTFPKEMKGKPWTEAEESLLDWILEPGKDFDENVKFTAQFYKDKYVLKADDEELRANGARSAYMGIVKQVICLAKTVPDLTDWWKRESSANFDRLGIVKGDANYNIIIAICQEHKRRLSEHKEAA